MSQSLQRHSILQVEARLNMIGKGLAGSWLCPVGAYQAVSTVYPGEHHVIFLRMQIAQRRVEGIDDGMAQAICGAVGLGHLNVFLKGQVIAHGSIVIPAQVQLALAYGLVQDGMYKVEVAVGLLHHCDGRQGNAQGTFIVVLVHQQVGQRGCRLVIKVDVFGRQVLGDHVFLPAPLGSA